MNATSRFAPSASSPWSVEEPSARTAPATTLSPSLTIGLWWISVPWFERMNLIRSYSSRVPLPSTTMCVASSSTTVAGVAWRRSTSPESTAARYSRPVPTSGACGIISGTACRCMFAPISARFASLCSRNGIIAVATETICAGETSMNWISFGVGHHGLALARAAEHLLVQELAGLLVDRLRGLRDRVLRLLGGVEVDDLVGHLAADDLAVRRLDEAELATPSPSRRASRSGRCSGLPASRSGTCGRSGSGGRRAPRSARARASGRLHRAPTGGGGG